MVRIGACGRHRGAEAQRQRLQRGRSEDALHERAPPVDHRVDDLRDGGGQKWVLLLGLAVDRVDDLQQVDLIGRTREGEATTGSSDRRQQACPGQATEHLRQMLGRDPTGNVDFGDGYMAIQPDSRNVCGTVDGVGGGSGQSHRLCLTTFEGQGQGEWHLKKDKNLLKSESR